MLDKIDILLQGSMENIERLKKGQSPFRVPKLLYFAFETAFIFRDCDRSCITQHARFGSQRLCRSMQRCVPKASKVRPNVFGPAF